MTKKEKIKYKDSIYEGVVKNGKPHGHGTMTWPKHKGATYVGEFNEGVYHGK